MDRRYTTGEYDFPARGPESIHDLGVPRNLPVLRPEEEPPADVAEVIEKARRSRDRFPTRHRVIVWSERESEIDVIYRDGAPQHYGEYYDWTGVKIRQARYFNLDEQYAEYHLPMPASAEEVLAWTETQVPVDLSICDGQRCLRQTGPLPPSFYTGGIECPTYDVITHPGQILDPTPANEYHRVFLEAMAFARNVRRHLNAVREAHAGNLAKG